MNERESKERAERERRAREERQAPGQIDPSVLRPERGIGEEEPPASGPMRGTARGPSVEPDEAGREGQPPTDAPGPEGTPLAEAEPTDEEPGNEG